MSSVSTGNKTAVTEEPSGPARVESRGSTWAGRVLSTLAVLFLLFDAIGKFVMPAQVVQAFARLGLPLSTAINIGVLLTVSTLIYAIPRTAVLGAVLLTGYLGGAVAIHIRAGSSAFETIFPALVGVLVWAGIYLRDCPLRVVFPFHR